MSLVAYTLSIQLTTAIKERAWTLSGKGLAGQRGSVKLLKSPSMLEQGV